MSSELDGRGSETDQPAETGTATKRPDGPWVPPTAGDNPVMSLDELYARRERIAAGHQETTSPATDNGRQQNGNADSADGSGNTSP